MKYQRSVRHKKSRNKIKKISPGRYRKSCKKTRKTLSIRKRKSCEPMKKRSSSRKRKIRKIYNKSFLSQKTRSRVSLPIQTTIKNDWISKQLSYMDHLTEEELDIVSLYKSKSIYEQVNAYQQERLWFIENDEGNRTYNFIRSVHRYFDKWKPFGSDFSYNIFNPHTNPDSRLVIYKFIEYYIFRLNTIIFNAPRLEEDINVCRGVTSKWFDGTVGEVFLSRGFISTSLKEEVCHGFSNLYGSRNPKHKHQNQFIFYSTLFKGTPVLYIGANEQDKFEDEVLLPSCTLIKIKEELQGQAYKGAYVVEFQVPQTVAQCEIEIPIEKYEKEYKKRQSWIFRPLSSFSNLQPTDTKGTSFFYKGNYYKVPFYLKSVLKKGNGSVKDRQNNYGVYDIELAINEFMASIIYQEIFHLPALLTWIVYNDLNIDDNPYPMYMLASRIKDIEDCSTQIEHCSLAPKALEGFLVDSIMANWDVGFEGNLVIDKQTNNSIRLDVGGSLLYRALGSPRKISYIPNEHITFLDPQNVSYKLFKNMTPSSLEDSFSLLKKADLSLMNDLFDNIIAQIRQFIKEVGDQDLAEEVVIKIIEFVNERTNYYLEHQSTVKTNVLDKIHKTRFQVL